jgi:hypothetical protein
MMDKMETFFSIILPDESMWELKEKKKKHIKEPTCT